AGAAVLLLAAVDLVSADDHVVVFCPPYWAGSRPESTWTDRSSRSPGALFVLLVGLQIVRAGLQEQLHEHWVRDFLLRSSWRRFRRGCGGDRGAWPGTGQPAALPDRAAVTATRPDPLGGRLTGAGQPARPCQGFGGRAPGCVRPVGMVAAGVEHQR